MNSREEQEEVVEEVAEVTETEETTLVELVVPKIVELARRPRVKVAEREAELSATKMISPLFERDLGLCCP